MENITYHEPHPLQEETLECWLTSIAPCSIDSNFYTYTITFKPPHGKWRAVCYVPSSQVNDETQRDLVKGPIAIPADDKSLARCTIKDLVGEDERRRECVRDLRLIFKAQKFTGHVYIPSSTPLGKTYQRIINSRAEKSIESEQPETPPRRTIEFLGPIRKNAQVRTEVWSLNGESYYRGGATVLRMKVEGGRKYLTIKAPVDQGEYALLVGDVGDSSFARCGRFEEVDDPDTPASDVFKMPPWVEQE